MNRRVMLAAGGFGIAFGFLISWGQFTDPDRIRQMLLLEDAYLYLMMFTAMGVGFAGIRILRRRRKTALLTGEPVTWSTERPRANHIAGAAIFGLGWAIADSCPAPIAAQLAQGVLWALPTIAGVLVGIELHFRRIARKAGSEAASPRRSLLSLPRPGARSGTT
ncbi:MAG: uncharacterized protein QOI10_236 [Solirubrobacterales bacterium]|jgi:uncharacterized membrane protein YedE/YeeE|nr:uncharacterized protein [Solirubrobacterales bacterium]